MKEKLANDYARLFSGSWPVWIGGLLLGVVNVFMFTYYQPWTTLDGVLNWGDWGQDALGINATNALSPLLRSGSVVNFGLLFGAFMSALLSKQFGIRVGPGRELAKGLIGGLLIGTGAALVRGCNIGGFFSGTSAMGLHGLGMALGLAIGAFFGARFLMWELTSGAEYSLIKLPKVNFPSIPLPAVMRNRDLQPYWGLLALLASAIAVFIYITGSDGRYADRGIILMFGLLLGIISQRSRICFVHAFREPFITGDASHTKAMLLALAVSIIGFAIVKDVIFEKVDEFVRPTFWQGSLIGGIIFGFGMTLAGGCGGGMIWRVGEGHVKLWAALVGYILSAAVVDDWLISSGTIDKLGEAQFLPDVVGWDWALIGLFALIIVWYLIVQWNETTLRFAAVK